MEDLAQAAIDAALKIGASFVDVRIENTTTTIIEINDAITKQSIASRMKGGWDTRFHRRGLGIRTDHRSESGWNAFYR